MRFLTIILCGVLCLVSSQQSGAYATATATLTIYPGENWFSCPLVPLTPTPSAVLGTWLGQCTLTKFDASAGKTVTYDPSTANFSLLLGEGYRLYNPTGTTHTCTYTGVADGVPDSQGRMADVWIALPGVRGDAAGGGQHWIGHPFNHDTSLNEYRLFVADGTEAVTFSRAVQLGWIDGTFTTFDNATKSIYSVGQDLPESSLRPGYAYTVTTHRDNLAIIIPAPEPGPIAVLAVGLLALIRKTRS